MMDKDITKRERRDIDLDLGVNNNTPCYDNQE